MNRRALLHIFIFLFITIGLHLILSELNLPGRLAFLGIIPILYATVHLFRSAKYLLKGEYKVAFLVILIAIFFVLIPVKIQYLYFNVIISSTLILISLSALRSNKSSFADKNKSILLILVIINFILLLTPDRFIYQYTNLYGKKWIPNITWDYFKGEPTLNTTHSASIRISHSYKINKLYNYPPAVLSTRVLTDSSWRILPETNEAQSILLLHEQGHLNIAEAYKRKAQDSVNNSWLENQEIIENTILHFAEKELKIQDKYDSLTENGKNVDVQKEWVIKINNMLENK